MHDDPAEGPAVTERRGREGARFDPEPWRREILAFVSRLGAGAESEDVVQEAFLRAIEKPPASRPRAYLYRIALNLLNDRRRGAARTLDAMPRLARPLESGGTSPSSAAERRDAAARALSVIETLPTRQRAALLLRVQRHMDYDDVALILDCSVEAARQQFHFAVKAVRDALAEDGDGS